MGITAEVDFKTGCREGMLGDKQFIEEVLTVVTSKKRRQIELHDLITKVCEQHNLTQEELCKTGKHPKPSEARAFLTLIVRELDFFSIESLAKILKRDSTTLIKAANRLELKSNKDTLFAKRMVMIRDWLEMSL
jgi:chromosomal replication initiation ATPase DnaA